MKKATIWMPLLLALCPLLLATDKVDDDDHDIAGFPFIFRGDSTLLDYQDPFSKRSVRIKVPRFFAYYSRDRIRNELFHYFEHGGIWTERVVLEILHHAVEPQRSLDWCGSLWLNESVHVCDWTGITCGDVEEASVHRDPAIDSYLPPTDAVTKIDLSQSALQGTLPSELIQLAHLQHLDLNDNSLQGTIPTEYGMFLRLRYLDLGDNHFEGSRPAHLGKLSNTLEELWLEKNGLSGSIHHSLSKLSHLSILDLSDNELTGTLPTEIGHLLSLSKLFLEVNRLRGPLPSEIGLLKELRVFDMGYNRFKGHIPSEIGLCTNLGHFSVVSNQLNGTVPLELFRLSNLEVLTLSENSLSGTLPTGDDLIYPRVMKNKKEDGFKWSDLTKIVALAMDNNHFYGTLPPEFLCGLAPSLTRYTSCVYVRVQQCSAFVTHRVFCSTYSASKSALICLKGRFRLNWVRCRIWSASLHHLISFRAQFQMKWGKWII